MRSLQGFVTIISHSKTQILGFLCAFLTILENSVTFVLTADLEIIQHLGALSPNSEVFAIHFPDLIHDMDAGQHEPCSAFDATSRCTILLQNYFLKYNEDSSSPAKVIAHCLWCQKGVHNASPFGLQQLFCKCSNLSWSHCFSSVVQHKERLRQCGL